MQTLRRRAAAALLQGYGGTASQALRSLPWPSFVGGGGGGGGWGGGELEDLPSLRDCMALDSTCESVSRSSDTNLALARVTRLDRPDSGFPRRGPGSTPTRGLRLSGAVAAGLQTSQTVCRFRGRLELEPSRSDTDRPRGAARIGTEGGGAIGRSGSMRSTPGVTRRKGRWTPRRRRHPEVF